MYLKTRKAIATGNFYEYDEDDDEDDDDEEYQGRVRHHASLDSISSENHQQQHQQQQHYNQQQHQLQNELRRFSKTSYDESSSKV
jgi:hypothetical protein